MTKRVLFLTAAILLGGAGFYLRYQNNQTVHHRAADIVAQDQAGVDQTTAVADLKDFVAAHSGASVGFTLSGSYNRALVAAEASTNANTATNQVYAAAQQACAGKSDSVTQARCNADYVATHLSNAAAVPPVPAPKSADYQYYLAAPFWIPDLSGALIVGALIALAAGIILFRQKGSLR